MIIAGYTYEVRRPIMWPLETSEINLGQIDENHCVIIAQIGRSNRREGRKHDPNPPRRYEVGLTRDEVLNIVRLAQAQGWID